jgi:hypothetical protein
VADQNTALTVSDHLIAYTSLTASRSVSLLPASTYEAGTLLTIVDESGNASSSKTISIVPDGTDTINGANATRTVISTPYGSATVESDGDSKWTVVRDSLVNVYRSYLAGLTLSNNSGTPNTKLDVAAGQCADSTNAFLMNVSAGTIDCGTTGANGLDTGSLANSTWYHVSVIGKVDGTTALLASASFSSPTLPSGYTLKRRIGSFKTDGSAHILGFVQDGDYFRWKASVLDVNDTDPGTSSVTKTLSAVPTGVNVMANINLKPVFVSASGSIYVRDLAANDEAPSETAAPLSTGSGGVSGAAGQTGGWNGFVRTNTSAQIAYRMSTSGASDIVRIAVIGWLDRRGRDA